MNNFLDRRNRILKIRSIERRIAETQLAQSETEVRHLSGLAERITTLRHATSVERGSHCGADLRANCEMGARLDTAQRSMAAPFASTVEHRDRLREKFITAKRRETGIEKLTEIAAERENRELEHRENALRIFRKTRFNAGAWDE
jgi:hypothetical protein